MIRVNLLNPGRPAEGWMPPRQRWTFVVLAMLLCTSAGLGGWWMSLARRAVAVEGLIAASERDLARLQAAGRLLERAAARRVELSQRLAMIARLRERQRGPVILLSTVSQSLPEGLWLVELTQRGTAVQIDGRAITLTSVTDFAERLQSSGSFARPVEIVTTSQEPVDEVPTVRFALHAQVLEQSGAGQNGALAPGAPPRTGE